MLHDCRRGLPGAAPLTTAAVGWCNRFVQQPWRLLPEPAQIEDVVYQPVKLPARRILLLHLLLQWGGSGRKERCSRMAATL